MARLPRVVVPGIPHHITQRGNRRQITFFDDEDYVTYLQCMRQACTQFCVKIWAYCLMTNHIHLIVVPPSQESLALAIGGGHEAYTRYIHFKKKWRGHFWQGRFSSFAMDDAYLYQAFPYVELNPVQAKMVQNPEDYEWSSSKVHLGLEENLYLDDVETVIGLVDNWKTYLEEAMEKYTFKEMEKHESTGRPLGSMSFLKSIEDQLGIRVIPKPPGPPPKAKK